MVLLPGLIIQNTAWAGQKVNSKIQRWARAFCLYSPVSLMMPAHFALHCLTILAVLNDKRKETFIFIFYSEYYTVWSKTKLCGTNTEL